jgi:gliding motility-associated-like protein
MKKILQILLLCLSCTHLYASHIVGGNIEMKALEKVPGKYLITLRLFQDNYGVENEKNTIPLFIYRKSDNQQLLSFTVAKDNEQKLVFANYKCAKDRNLEILARVYTAVIQLNPDDYSDAKGYYMFWENCCRNAGIDNIIKSSEVGSMFYLQFPPLKKNGSPFLNSTPAFDPINGEYLCLNTTSRINFDAKDDDGDELRYSFVTPIAGTITLSSKSAIPYNYTPQGKTNYPLINWESGFNANTPLAGQSKLDSKKGFFTFTPNKIGLYAFAVRVEEIRNGEVIGFMIRDFQYLVVDCPPSPIPVLDMSIVGFPPNTSPVTVCEGLNIRFSVPNNTTYEYQWQRDGDNITGENKNFYTANVSGTYDVEVSLKNLCTKTVSSKSVVLNVIKLKSKLSPEPSKTGCLNGYVVLKAQKGTGNVYKWYKDGTLMSGINPNQDSLKTTQIGKYYARIDNPNGCFSLTDTISVNFETKNRRTYLTSSTGKYSFCPSINIQIKADSTDDFQYKWFKDGSVLSDTKPSLTVSQSGKYRAELFDAQTGCTYQSDTVNVTQLNKPIAQISTTGNSNSICVGDSIELKGVNLLKATVQWKKDGVDIGKNTFSYFTKLKGVFTYSVTDSSGCKNESAVFQVDTTSKITISFLPPPLICGSSNPAITLTASPTGGQFSGLGVNSIGIFDPKISGIGIHKITYKIDNAVKCKSGESTINVNVSDLPSATLPKEISIAKGSSVVLKSGVNTSYSYSWAPNTFLNNGLIGNPTTSTDKNIDYTVTITDANGCKTIKTIKVFVAQRLLIPTAFTPNNDGQNDVWEIFGKEAYPEIEVSIFDRWGNIVFYSKGYQTAFDGKSANGNDLAVGSYAYVVKYALDKESLTGCIEVIR